MNQVSLKGYSFFMGTINLLRVTDNNIVQIPINFKDRTRGKSKYLKLKF